MRYKAAIIIVLLSLFVSGCDNIIETNIQDVTTGQETSVNSESTVQGIQNNVSIQNSSTDLGSDLQTPEPSEPVSSNGNSENTIGEYEGDFGTLTITTDSDQQPIGTIVYHMLIGEEERSLTYSFKKSNDSYVFTNSDMMPEVIFTSDIIFEGNKATVKDIIGHTDIYWDSLDYFGSKDLDFTKK